MVRCLVMLRISVFPKSTREPLRDLKQVVDMVTLLFFKYHRESIVWGRTERDENNQKQVVFITRDRGHAM